jgi:hypothetical protein
MKFVAEGLGAGSTSRASRKAQEDVPPTTDRA